MRPYLGVLPRVLRARNSAFSAPRICTVDDCGGTGAEHQAQTSGEHGFVNGAPRGPARERLRGTGARMLASGHKVSAACQSGAIR